MIDNFVKAWDKNNHLLLELFQKESPSSYEDIVEKLVKVVINPYLDDIGEYELDIEKMTVIDDGDYQGTTIYIIPFDTYQPSVYDYVFTNNYYGSCSGCDTFIDIVETYDYDKKRERKIAAKQFHNLALHLLQSFKPLEMS